MAEADPNIRDHSGQFPLYLAAVQGNEQVCRMLLEHGADPSFTFREKTAAEHAKLAGHERHSNFIQRYPMSDIDVNVAASINQSLADRKQLVCDLDVLMSHASYLIVSSDCRSRN